MQAEQFKRFLEGSEKIQATAEKQAAEFIKQYADGLLCYGELGAALVNLRKKELQALRDLKKQVCNK